MNFWETLILFFSFQALIFCIYLLVKRKGNKVSHRLWAFFLFLFAFNIYYNVLYWSRINTDFLLQITGTYVLAMALYGPIFFLYLRSLIREKSLTWKDTWHFLPFFLVAIQIIPFLLLPAESKVVKLQSGQGIFIFGNLLEYLIVLGMIVYGVAGWIEFQRSKTLENRDLSLWLKIVCISFVGFGMAFLSYYVLVYWGFLKIEHDYGITLMMIVFIGITTYFGLEFPAVFNGKPLKSLVPFTKYETTGLSPELSLKLKGHLDQLMHDKKPYLDGDLRLDDLAEALNLSRHHTSQIINEHYEMNFFEFINKHRIREAIRLLERGDRQITEVAYQSGFNNRTSFYKAFKKEFGMAPGAYLEMTA